MSLLKAEPPEPVRSLGELFALAHELETEAATRYAVLAGDMEALDLPAVAAVFRQLVEEEHGHAAHVERWAQGMTGAPLDASRLRWHPPETFDEEAARRIASSRLASAYRALSMAVRNEERAFALWSYIAAQADSPGIRAAAERLAGEELNHAALLRRARRQAFHAERDGAAGRLPPLLRAAQAETLLAGLLPRLATSGAAPAASAAELQRQAGMAEAMAREAAALAGGAPAEPPQPGLPGDALSLADLAAEAYLEAADAAREEERVQRLQSLAADAIARVALLRRLLGGA